MLSKLKGRARGWLSANPRVHELAVPLIQTVRPGRADLLPTGPPGRLRIRVPGRRQFDMLDLGGRDQIVRQIREGGWSSYEMPLPQVLAACAARSVGSFVDVGANTGFYTLLALTCGRRLSGVAFEPFPPALEALEANLALNPVGRRAEVVAKAVGDAGGRAELWLPPAEHGLIETSSSLSAAFKEAHSGSITVDVIRLDDHRWEGRIPAILKIDVESLEHVVLAGAVGILEEFRPLVFLEVLPKGDAAALESLRSRLRYTDVRLLAAEAVVGESVAFDERAWNHLLIPDEALDRWRPVVESALASSA